MFFRLFVYPVFVLLCTITSIYADAKDEVKLGRGIAAVLAGSYGIYDREPLTKYVNLVGNSVAFFNARDDITYYFAILDSDSINAFACPGGYIFITRGLLFSLKNEAELAGVLAHEIAHVNYKHVYNNIVQRKDNSANTAIAKLIGGRNVSLSVAFNQVVQKGLEILLKKGLSREDEFNADAAACSYLETSGYQVHAYLNVLGRLQANQQGHEKYSITHPAMKDRINNLNSFALPASTGQNLQERFDYYVVSP